MSDVLEIGWFLSMIAAVLTAPSVLINRKARPVAAVGWLLALFALPPVALAAWWLIGRTHLRRRRLLRREASVSIDSALTDMEKDRGRRLTERKSRLVVRLPAALQNAVFPSSEGNAVKLLPETPTVHEAWAELIVGAQEHIHVLFFAWHPDRTGRWFLQLLEQKVRDGVEVRVLYDAVGCEELPKGFFDGLKAMGGEVAAFLPVRLLSVTPVLNFRNHRKLVIADGRRAYTGGINVTDEYLDWQDIGIQLEGPVVNSLQEVFVDDWYYATSRELVAATYFPEYRPGGPKGPATPAVCEAIASGPDQLFNATRELLFVAVTRTQSRLWIATPYFIPDEALLLALRTAVYRGIDVKLFLPGRSDSPLVRRASRAYYSELLQSGVGVFEYDGMLHAKAVLFDDDNVLIGSANLDLRSFRLNFELSTFIESAALNQDLERWFSAIEAKSTVVTESELQNASYFGQLKDALAHLLSPLL